MKIIKFSAMFLASAFMLAACAEKPKSDEAEVGEAKEVAEVEASAASYAVQAAESSVSWVGTKPTGRHNGTIAIEEGTIAVENGEIVGGKVMIDLTQIDVADLEGEDEQKLAGHLQSPDFFNVGEHPKGTFEIVSVEQIGSGEMNNASAEDADATAENTEVMEPASEEEYRIANPTHKITGNLTLRGNTKSVTFPARVEMSGDKLMAKAKFNIDRTEWGISYGDESKAVDKAKDQFIYNTVNVGFDLVASESTQEPVTASSEEEEMKNEQQ